jgi:hypothetical protein
MRTHNLSRQAAADLRLWSRGHWDRLPEKNTDLKQEFTSLWIVLLQSHHTVETTSAFTGLPILHIHFLSWLTYTRIFKVVEITYFQCSLKHSPSKGRTESGNLAEFRIRAYLVYENVTGANGMPEHMPTLRNIWRRCQEKLVLRYTSLKEASSGKNGRIFPPFSKDAVSIDTITYNFQNNLIYMTTDR